MPLKKKLKALKEDIDKNEDDFDDYSESMSDNSESNEESDFDSNEEIMIDFEARDIDESDFNSINLLLQQKLGPLKNLCTIEIAKYLTEQKLGNIIYQVISDENDDENKTPDNENNDNTDDDTIFGVLSIVDLNSPKCNKLATNLKNFIVKECNKHDKQYKTNLIDQLNEIIHKKNVFYIVNERFINIPPAISVPMFESLLKDLDENKLEYDYWLFLSKIYDETTKNGENTSATCSSNSSKLYVNPEEEIFEDLSEIQFEITYQNKSSKNNIDDPKQILKCFFLSKKYINDAISKVKSLI